MKNFIAIILTVLCYQTNAQNNFIEANNEYLNGDLKVAIELYTKSIYEKIEVEESHIMRGASYALLDNMDASLLDLDSARQINSQNCKLYYYYGRTYLLNQLYDRSILYFDTALQCDPTYGKAYNEKGNALFILGRIQESIHNLRKSIELDTLSYSAYCDIGYVYFANGQSDSALFYTNKSIALHPSLKAFTNRGLVYFNIKEYKLAIRDFSKSLEFAYNDADVLFLRGQCFRSLDDKERACKDFEVSAKLGSKESMALISSYCHE